MSVPSGPVTSIAEAIARMQAIVTSRPPADGLACRPRTLADSPGHPDSHGRPLLLVAV